MMRVLIEFLLFMCCLASIFQLALVIRRYMAIKKDWLLSKSNEKIQGKIKLFIQSSVTGCFILTYFILRLY
ncbi:TPA: hypothetical protein QCY03_003467 [Bacillus tropicus]|nr:hypothetical protein [Bacillus tropicus]